MKEYKQIKNLLNNRQDLDRSKLEELEPIESKNCLFCASKSHSYLNLRWLMIFYSTTERVSLGNLHLFRLVLGSAAAPATHSPRLPQPVPAPWRQQPQWPRPQLLSTRGCHRHRHLTIPTWLPMISLKLSWNPFISITIYQVVIPIHPRRQEGPRQTRQRRQAVPRPFLLLLCHQVGLSANNIES